MWHPTSLHPIHCRLLGVGALVLVAACSPSTRPDNSVPPPRVADTALFVGARVPLYSLVSATGGLPYSPAATTHARVVAGNANAIELTGDSVFAVSPGAILVEIRDDAAKWARTFRIGSVYDIRRAWHFGSLCRSSDVSVNDYSNTLTYFVSTEPATATGPSWDLGDRPSASATVRGTRTDSVFHFYLHPDNHIRPDTAVYSESVISTIGVDSSTDIQFSWPNAGETTLARTGATEWSTDAVTICGDGAIAVNWARLDAL